MKKAGHKTVDIESYFLCMRRGNNNYIYIYFLYLHKQTKEKERHEKLHIGSEQGWYGLDVGGGWSEISQCVPLHTF